MSIIFQAVSKKSASFSQNKVTFTYLAIGINQLWTGHDKGNVYFCRTCVLKYMA